MGLSLHDGVKIKMPVELEPMLATLADSVPEGDDWVYEVKWDGYRAVSYINKNKTHLSSRNNKSFDDRFYPVVGALKELPFKAVLDGEIIVINDKGVSDFGALQNWRSEADGELVYYVFDLLWYEGYSLMDLPFSERRKKLREILPVNDTIRLSQVFETGGVEFLEAANKMDMEGIMAKRDSSEYHPFTRTREWLKVKTGHRHEVVIGGFTNNEGSPKPFSALLVGLYEKGKLKYTGKVGTGFSDKLQKEMMAAFKPLITDVNPFSAEPDVNKPTRFRPNPPKAKATWLKPELVCEVQYTEITSDKVMRHPSFVGMRIDKKAKQVKEEKPVSVKKEARKIKRKTRVNPGRKY